jgi:predicted regulator of Ras-like GTPase activity (Roadblock/LC7/MglB family)
MAASRTEALLSILKDLQASTADVEATAVVSVDGLMMASALPADVEEDRVAAMSAAMLSLGDRTAQELGRGSLEQVFIRGADGYVILMNAGADSVLTAMTRADSKLGLIFLDMKRTADEICKLI